MSEKITSYQYKSIMKLVFIFITTFLFYLQSNSQSWHSLDSGLNSMANCMEVYNAELYVGGDFIFANGDTCNHIAKWDGNKWSKVGLGANGSVRDMCVFNGELYICGSFSIIGNNNCIYVAKWNGTNFTNVDSGINYLGSGTGINDLCIYNGDLYCVGGFSSKVLKLIGSHWADISTGIFTTGSCTSLSSMATYNGELYVGGSFHVVIGSDTCGSIMKYNGTNWSTVGIGIVYGYVNGMLEFNNELYVVGNFPFNFGNPGKNIAKWNGNSWSQVGGGFTSDINGGGTCLLKYNNQLIIGGDFTKAFSYPTSNFSPYVVGWDGLSWKNMNTNLSSIGGGLVYVNSLQEYKNKLYACGYFTQLDQNNSNNIAQLDAALNTIDYKLNNKIIITPNPATNFTNILFSSLHFGTKIIVFGMLGEKILELNNIHEEKYVLNCKQLNKGSYIVCIILENKIISKQILIIK